MQLPSDPYNLIICGVGGQGNILISRLIGRILAAKGFSITIGETFGAAQRGGAVSSSMRLSQKRYYGPLIPRGRANLVLSLEPLETLRTLVEFGNQETITISNNQPIYPVGVLAGRFDYPEPAELERAIGRLSREARLLNVTQKALELQEPIVANIVLLGCLLASGRLPMDEAEVESEIRATIPQGKQELNLKALEQGRELYRSGS